MDIRIVIAQVDEEGGFECPECGAFLEPDAECACGADNPLRARGLI